jgi:hypothetical protein
MRQIHAAIEHWQRGDFECAIALASAASEMLPDFDEHHFGELQDISRVNEISNWLVRGASRERLKSGQIDTVVIEELDTVLAIHRAILKFEAIFWKDKTPQMKSFCNCVRTQGRSNPNHRETEQRREGRRI